MMLIVQNTPPASWPPTPVGCPRSYGPPSAPASPRPGNTRAFDSPSVGNSLPHPGISTALVFSTRTRPRPSHSLDLNDTESRLPRLARRVLGQATGVAGREV